MTKLSLDTSGYATLLQPILIPGAMWPWHRIVDRSSKENLMRVLSNLPRALVLFLLHKNSRKIIF
jgi:hypothetical protein